MYIRVQQRTVRAMEMKARNFHRTHLTLNIPLPASPSSVEISGKLEKRTIGHLAVGI